MLLQDANGETLAVTDFHCYVQTRPGHRLLVWYAEEEGEDAAFRRDIRFRLLDADRLRPIRDFDAGYAQLGSRSRFYAEGGELATVALSTALADGVHEVTLPESLRDLGEVLVLAHSTAHGRRENHHDTMHLCLWILDTVGGRLTILPQDWFNNGKYDFSYQWVTRVARVPQTGDLVGEGIRLGVFQLGRSGRRVAHWLAKECLLSS
jgi:hypothetical protein